MVESVKTMIVERTIAKMISDAKKNYTIDVLLECAKNAKLDYASKYYVINSLTASSCQFGAMWAHSTPRRREFWMNCVNSMLNQGIELHSLLLNS